MAGGPSNGLSVSKGSKEIFAVFSGNLPTRGPREVTQRNLEEY